jgi:hypothetical protein
MKYLSDYMNDKQDKLFKDTGSFFAFSKGQFEEQKKEGVEYVNMSAGLIAPKEQSKKVYDALQQIFKDAVKQDLEENGKVGVIKRELANHECYYTDDWHDAIDALDGYGITDEEIKDIFYNARKEIV